MDASCSERGPAGGATSKIEVPESGVESVASGPVSAHRRGWNAGRLDQIMKGRKGEDRMEDLYNLKKKREQGEGGLGRNREKDLARFLGRNIVNIRKGKLRKAGPGGLIRFQRGRGGMSLGRLSLHALN